MKLTIPRDALLTALHSASEIARGGINPGEKCILLDATGSKLRVHADTNFQTVTIDVPADIEAAGVQMVNVDNLTKRANALPPGDVRVVAKDTKIEFSVGKSARFSCGVYTAEAMPTIARVEPMGSPIGAAAFAQMVGRISVASGKGTAGAWNDGVILTGSGGALEAIATDGRMLARDAMAFDGAMSTILPVGNGKGSPVASIEAMFGKWTGDARITVIGNRFHVFTEGLAYSCLTLDPAAIPGALRELLPKREGVMFECSRAELLTAVKAIATIDPVNGSAVFRMVSGELVISGVNQSGDDTLRTIHGTGSFGASRYALELMSYSLGLCSADRVEMWRGPDHTDGDRRLAASPVSFFPKGSEYGSIVMSTRFEPGDTK